MRGRATYLQPERERFWTGPVRSAALRRGIFGCLRGGKVDAMRAELGLLAGWFEERKRRPEPGRAERGDWKCGVWGGSVWRLASFFLIC